MLIFCPQGFQIGVLEAECFVIKCALGAAELILRGAKGIVEGVAYNTAKVAVDIAEGALVGAQNMLAGAIAGAQSFTRRSCGSSCGGYRLGEGCCYRSPSGCFGN